LNVCHQARVSWFNEMNARAATYANTRLKKELWTKKNVGERSTAKFVFAFNFLRGYYVFSAPVVTIVARSDRLMSIARMLNAPTKHVIRRILG
jgi:hypothetical protein